MGLCSMPSSFSARSSPAYAASLKLLSPRPPDLMILDYGFTPDIADSAAIAIPVRLMVLDEDVQKAKALLEEADIA
mgnify:CR=1 FL=1